MDSKKNIKGEVLLALEVLHKKLEFLKEKVDKLCEATGCFDEVRKKTKNSSKNERQ